MLIPPNQPIERVPGWSPRELPEAEYRGGVDKKRRDQDRVSITVCDSGHGVADEALENIFKPFFRLESARDRRSGGTGLGLAIVKSSVEAMKGTVTAKNLQPKGFAVEIVLPATTA